MLAGKRGFSKNRRGSRGSVQLIFTVVALVMAIGGFGVWGIFRNWRFQVEHQLRLNRCVGGVAHELRDTLNKIDSMNEQIRQLRSAILVAQVQPESIPLLQTALEAVVKAQDLLLLHWRGKQAQWVALSGCKNRRDYFLPLPNLKYVRALADHLGPRQLIWLEGEPRMLFIHVSHKNRHAAARIEKDDDGKKTLTHRWKTYWTAPQRPGRTGVD
jgi:hypothetical protein